jgi:hypothetical protein
VRGQARFRIVLWRNLGSKFLFAIAKIGKEFSKIFAPQTTPRNS